MAKQIPPSFLEIDDRDLGKIVGYRQVRNPRWPWLRHETIPVYEDVWRELVFASPEGTT